MKSWDIHNVSEQEKKEFIISCLNEYIDLAEGHGLENLYPAVQEVVSLYREIIRILEER